MAYLHGYSPEEARRLRAQADHLAPWVFSVRPLDGCRRILEVGSGVGGQTALILKLYPGACVTALEREHSSHEACVEWLKSVPGASERVTPVCADALRVNDGHRRSGHARAEEAHSASDALSSGGVRNLDDQLRGHDGAFICWVLEHSEAPSALLRAVRSCLAPGGLLAVFEVFNQSFCLSPEMPGVAAEYFAAYNRLQRSLGGDPDVGARLGQLLHEAGYRRVTVSSILIQLDDRDPERRQQMFDYMGELMRSAEAALLEARMPEAALAEAVQRELQSMGRRSGSVFHYTIMHATAEA
ncbi:MAG: hypothetical protein RJA70_4059 [Pseudomonadota bacterium]|jgi:SAM-dependent methyltransferase